MKISEVNFKKGDKSKIISDLVGGYFDVPLKKELKELTKTLENAITTGNFLVARNSIIVSIYFQYDETFSLIRKKGLFRYSKYINRRCSVKNLASEIITICKSLNLLANEEEQYLNSIINYSSIIDSYNSFDKFILAEIKSFERDFPGKSLIKTLLSSIDFLFLSNYFPHSRDDLSNVSGRTKEELSSAVSFLLYFYTERIKSQGFDTSSVSEEYVETGRIQRLIIPVCYHLDFREFEIMIDHFGYKCLTSEGKLLIKPSFDSFEKAIRLGYIRTELQRVNDRMSDNYESASIEELVNEISKDTQFFRLVDTNNYQRYRVEIPEPIFDFLIEKFIKPDKLFKEEMGYLSSIFKEQLLRLEDLERINIKDDLTLAEFMKIRRVFITLYLLFAKEIYKIDKVDTGLVLRSLIPVFPEKTFYELIGKLLPDSKIDSFLDVTCWEPGIETILDLQYRPILFFDNQFLVPLSVFANSNTIRNLYASEYKQNNTGILRDGKIDPLANSLMDSLSEASLNCYSQTPIGITDIDVFAVYENVLFVFECKHSLHPVSTFDLRTTNDYIKKAEKQLDLIVLDFQNGTLLKKLERKHNIRLNQIEKIQGAIVLSNRLLNGNIFKYPVRNIREIDNMLNRGTMKTENGTFWLWKDKRLSLEFLLDYFSSNNKLINLFFDSLTKRTKTYEFARPVIEFDTYSLEMRIALPKLKEYTDTLEIKVEN